MTTGLPKQKYDIYDLDNCLFDDSWRIPLIDWSQDDIDKRYLPYHAGCGDDKPGNIDAFRDTIKNNIMPIFVTARPEFFRENTAEQIAKYFLSCDLDYPDDRFFSYLLFMREAGNSMSSVELKRHILRTKIFGELGIKPYEIRRAHDDIKEVLAMYKQEQIFDVVHLKIHDLDAMKPPVVLRNIHASHVSLVDGGAQCEVVTGFSASTHTHGSNFSEVPLEKGEPIIEELAPIQIPTPSDMSFGRIMESLYPAGVTIKSARDFEIHLGVSNCVLALMECAAEGDTISSGMAQMFASTVDDFVKVVES
jgi:hypothetical protein